MKIKNVMLAGLLAVFTSLPTYASPIPYYDAGLFQTAISTMNSQTLGFDSLVLGNTIEDKSSLGGVTFEFDFGELDMIVSNKFAEHPGNNYLGINDEADESFSPGDSFTMSFGGARLNALGLYIITITDDEIWDGDFSLETSGGPVISEAILQRSLANGSDLFFLGLTDIDGFDKVTFSSDLNSCDCFYFNIDDITTAQHAATAVSEPAISSLLILGFMVLVSIRRLKG
jgi:hypothetical protein